MSVTKDWKKNVRRKKERGSSLAGKKKGGTCVASPKMKFYSKYSRASKRRDYPRWSKMVRKYDRGNPNYKSPYDPR